jgi:hypothetical protein
MNARLRVAWIGGVHRAYREIVDIGDEMGIDVEVHDGRTTGRRLSALVRRMDVVIVVIGIVSHAAVQVAKREAAKSGARVHVLTSSGCGAARALLRAFVQEEAASAS